MAVTDPYAVLGVARDATQDVIKSAYRKLARQFHPDVNPGDSSAEEKFKEISEAYQILSDPERRQRFDQFGTTDDQFAGGGGAHFQGGGFGDLFDMFFGAAGQGQSRARQGTDGEDVRVDIQLELKDILTEQKRTVTYPRAEVCEGCSGSGNEGGKPRATCNTCKGAGSVTRVQNTILGQMRTSTTCPTCHGEGSLVDSPCKTCRGRGTNRKDVTTELNIPSGIDDGATIRYPAQGGKGVNGGVSGDLYAVISIKDDGRFERDGTELLAAINLSIVQATLGHTLEIEGLTEKITLNVPAGTQPGHVFRFKGQGVPRLRSTVRGDLHVQVHVKVPTKLSEGQVKLLKEFAELSGEDVKPTEGSWLEGLFKWKK